VEAATREARLLEKTRSLAGCQVTKCTWNNGLPESNSAFEKTVKTKSLTPSGVLLKYQGHTDRERETTMTHPTNVDFSYPFPRPSLTIENTGGKQLGRCYSASYHKVTSRFRLSKESLDTLFRAGVIGSGQGFYIRSQCDGTEKAAMMVDAPCVMRDRRTGETIPGVAINPYSGKPYAPIQYEYFVYECETTCDSGD
jgi:hypothetical protein